MEYITYKTSLVLLSSDTVIERRQQMPNQESRTAVLDDPKLSQPNTRPSRRSLFSVIKYGTPAVLASAVLASCGSSSANNKVHEHSSSLANVSKNGFSTQRGPRTLLAGSRHIETEQQSQAITFNNYEHASGVGPDITEHEQVTVDCRAIGPLDAAPSAHGNLQVVHLPDGGTEKQSANVAVWYHMTGPARFAGRFVAANTFDNGDTSGPLNSQPAYDPSVPVCPPAK
jgi:hypothetical protein